MQSSNVVILLASYEGSAYIREQIDSIRAQTYKDWLLYVRDDGSHDETVTIVNRMAAMDERIQLIPRSSCTNGGAAANFAALMQLAAGSDGRYFMFADQDDVWVPGKIDMLLDSMGKLEVEGRPEMPALVHSDLEVVDASLQRLHPSFFRYQGIRHQGENALRILFPQNFVTGCTVLFNRPALDLALPVPDDVVMHDWWLALVVAATGQIGFVDRPTVRYRQHGLNQVGAKSLWDEIVRSNGSLLERIQYGDRHFVAGINQARHLCRRLMDRSVPVLPNHAHLIACYADLMQTSRTKRLLQAARFGIGPQNIFRRMLFYSRLVRLPVQ